MANVKITELVELAAVDLADNDVLPIVDVGSDATKKVTIVSLRSFASANDYVTFTSLSANIDAVQSNVNSAEANIIAYAAAANSNLSATYISLTSNINAAEANIIAYAAVSNANLSATYFAALANDYLTVTFLSGELANTNTYLTTNYATLLLLDTVQDNVVAAESNVVAVEARRSDNTFYTYNAHSVVSTANIIPSTNNILSLGAPDAVYKDVYVGPGTVYIGSVRLSDTDGALTITSADDSSSIVDTQTSNVTAALNTVQDNVATVTTSSAGIETRRAANVTIQDTATTAVETRRAANVTIQDTATTAVETRRAANVTIQDTATTAVETRRAANVTIQDTATTAVETRRAANVTIQDTATTAVETRRAANIAGAISTVTTGNLSTARALVSDESGKIAASTITTVTLGYLDATSSIQNQLNTKAPLADPTFTGLVTASHDLVVSGNLTVNGETTTINSANKVIQDRFIMLANAVSGAPSGDVGIFLNRGTSGNAAIYYDESAKSFTLSETRDPDTNVTIHPTGAANLVVGAFSASTVSFNGVDLNTAITDNVTSLATATTALEARRTANIAGAVSTITTGNLTVSRALVSDGAGKVAASTITTTVLGYLDATSSVQTQIDSKIATTDSASNDYITYTALNSADAALEARRTANIAGAVSTITTGNLTVDRALVSDGSGKVAASTITSTTLGYLDATSSVQTQIDSKQATITGAATTIDTENLTVSRALVSDASGKVAISAVTAVEVGYLDGVSSAIQTQIDSKQASLAGATLDLGVLS
jgi:hypothetical protein